jgi:signal transduction histidine kinase
MSNESREAHDMATTDRNSPQPVPVDPLPNLTKDSLATLSHELRTPLAAIKGFTTTLLRHHTRLSIAEQRDFLEEINHASDRLGLIIDQVLQLAQLARLDAVPRVGVDLAQIAAQVVGLLHQDRAAPSIRVEINEGPTPPADRHVVGDAQLLTQLLRALLANARQHAPTASVIALRLSYRVTGEHVGEAKLTHPMAHLQVHDQGNGIPAAELERIFAPFYQVDARLSREIQGLGLGLAYCASIVALHHGLIWAESAPGDGATLNVLLPVQITE